MVHTPVQVVYEDEGISTREELRLHEYIAMAFTVELTSNTSRMVSDITTSTNTDAIAAMNGGNATIVRLFDL